MDARDPWLWLSGWRERCVCMELADNGAGARQQQQRQRARIDHTPSLDPAVASHITVL